MSEPTSSPTARPLPKALRRQRVTVQELYHELRDRGALRDFLPVSVRELARAIRRHPTTIYAAARTLEQLGYLRRLPHDKGTGTAWTLYDAPPLSGTTTAR